MVTSIRQALNYVANHPDPPEEPINTPVWELVCRNLFDIANSPNPKVRGSMGRANRAQTIIMDRMVGTRAPGTAPAKRVNDGLRFVDLTSGELE